MIYFSSSSVIINPQFSPLNPNMMNFTAKPVAAQVHHRPRPHIPVSINHHRLISSRPISFISLRTPIKPQLFFIAPIKASTNSASGDADISKPIPIDRTNNRISSQSPFLKATTVIATTLAAAALFFSRFYLFAGKPAIAFASSYPSSATVETASNDAVSDEEKEKSLEEHLLSHPNDVDALRSLMEIRIKHQKTQEAILIVEKLIELEPDEVEWPLMKSHLHAYAGEADSARNGFNEIITKDPFRVEAYHGLVMVASQDDGESEELTEVMKRIDEAMTLCKKEDKKGDLRDFKLLQAQILVIEGKYREAINVYQDLVKDEPRDFRPYLCQGIIFTLLRNKDEAEKNFEKYKRLVPKGHPYARYFEDNMIATKVFSQKVENEMAGSKS